MGFINSLIVNAQAALHVATTPREEGQAMVEYGVLAALIAAVSIVIITTLGKQVEAAFTSVSSALPALAG